MVNYPHNLQTGPTNYLPCIFLYRYSIMSIDNSRRVGIIIAPYAFARSKRKKHSAYGICFFPISYIRILRAICFRRGGGYCDQCCSPRNPTAYLSHLPISMYPHWFAEKSEIYGVSERLAFLGSTRRFATRGRKIDAVTER